MNRSAFSHIPRHSLYHNLYSSKLIKRLSQHDGISNLRRYPQLEHFQCSLKGDVPINWERIYSVEIISVTILLYKLTHLVDYCTLESDSVSPLYVYYIHLQCHCRTCNVERKSVLSTSADSELNSAFRQELIFPIEPELEKNCCAQLGIGNRKYKNFRHSTWYRNFFQMWIRQ